jgi:hypothetical protein
MSGAWQRSGLLVAVSSAALALSSPAFAQYKPLTEGMAVDLTPTVSMSHKQYWPAGRSTISRSSFPTSSTGRVHSRPTFCS